MTMIIEQNDLEDVNIKIARMNLHNNQNLHEYDHAKCPCL